MATDPTEHPVHQVPEELPLPPGDLPPSTEQPTIPQQPQLPESTETDNLREVEDESGDPVGLPPKM